MQLAEVEFEELWELIDFDGVVVIDEPKKPAPYYAAKAVPPPKEKIGEQMACFNPELGCWVRRLPPIPVEDRVPPRTRTPKSGTGGASWDVFCSQLGTRMWVLKHHTLDLVWASLREAGVSERDVYVQRQLQS